MSKVKPKVKPKVKTKVKTKGGDEFTSRQRRFIEEYLVDLNATQAALRAGYSKKGASVQGCQLLANPKIAAALDKARAKLSDRTEITQERIVREYGRIAFAWITDYSSWTNEGVVIKNSDELSPELKSAVAEVIHTQSRDRSGVRLKMHDKMGALDSLGKHLGMFTEKREIKFNLDNLTDEQLLALSTISISD